MDRVSEMGFKPMTSDSERELKAYEEIYRKLVNANANHSYTGQQIWSEIQRLKREVTEEGSSTDDRANTTAHSELAQEAQSEAPSVDEILDELVNEAVEVALSQNFKIGDELKTYKEAKAKINRLIDDAVIGFASELKESFRGKIIPYKNDGERQIVEQAYHDWTNAIDDALSNNLSKGGV